MIERHFKGLETLSIQNVVITFLFGKLGNYPFKENIINVYIKKKIRSKYYAIIPLRNWNIQFKNISVKVYIRVILLRRKTYNK